VEFSIRTPVTPPRWAAFEVELAGAYAAVVEAVRARDDPAGAGAAALRLGFYWFAFMPLARGSAAVGCVLVLASLAAAGVPGSTPPPPGVQVDWEAILASSPAEFEAAVAGWLLPARARRASGEGTTAAAACAPGGGPAPSSSSSTPFTLPAFDPDDLPSVASTLVTARQRVEALNGPGGQPVRTHTVAGEDE